MEPVTLEDLLAAQQAEQDQINEALGAQLGQSQELRNAAALQSLAGLQAQADTQGQFIDNATAPVAGGLAAFTDSFTGSNFSRASQALANQRALLASGSDAGSRQFRQDIAAANNIVSDQALSAKDSIRLDLENKKADAKLQTDALKLQLQAQKDAEKAQREAERDQFNRDLRLRQEARADRRVSASIESQNRRDTLAATKSSSKAAGAGRGANLKPTQIQKISDIDTTLDIINQMEGLIRDPENQDLLGPVNARSNNLNVFDQGTRNRQIAFNRSLGILRQDVAKLLEGGKLVGSDEAKFERLLPSDRDSPEVAFKKLKTVRDRILRERKRRIGNLEAGGFNVSPFKDVDGTSPDAPAPAPAAPAQTTQPAAGNGFDIDSFIDTIGQ